MSTTTDTATVPRATWEGGPTVVVRPGTASPVAALVDASRLAATEAFSAQVGFLLQHVGPRVIWGALGLKDPRMLTKWWRGGAEPKSPVTVDRVHLLFQVSYAITSVFDGATAARFLRVRSPRLGYQAPGEYLAQGGAQEVEADVIAAADQFLNG
jgi:hypothetical protein